MIRLLVDILYMIWVGLSIYWLYHWHDTLLIFEKLKEEL